jgi:DNA ligase-1
MARGTNAKLRVLEKHKDNVHWKRALYYMYDTSKNYYCSPPNDLTFIDTEIVNYDQMFNLLDALSSGEFRGKVGKSMALQGSRDYGEILRLIMGGSLKSGVSTTSINKVYKNLIPTYPLMLAENAEVTRFPVWASTKFDGVRLIVRVENGKVTPRTRAGKFLDLQSLIISMKSLPNGVYDGELIMGNGRQASRTKITGAVNRILNGQMTDISGYTYQIFDYLTIAEWDMQYCDRPLLTRYSELNDISFSDEYIKRIEHKELLIPSDIDDMFKDHIARGFEGLILRYMDDPYVWKRSTMLIKQKATYTAVLRCADVIEGKGKFETLVGALVCEGMVEHNNKDVFVRVKVGTGLNDFDREAGAHSYIDHEIEVDYNDVVKAENNDYYSLFLPVYKRRVGGI